MALRGPECVNAASSQKLLRANSLEEFLGVIEKFPRLFADGWVVEDRRIASAQFPRVKKRRPIDEGNEGVEGRYLARALPRLSS